MPLPSSRFAALAAGAALIGVAGAALGQETPESILPPGFGQPAPPPPPAAAPGPGAPAPSPAIPGAAPPPAGSPAPPPLDPIGAIVAGLGEEQATDLPPEEEAADQPIEIPDEARRALSPAGAIEGYGFNAFGGRDGRFLATLMQRMRAPIASRWMQIALRRLLLTRMDTPAGVEPADWVAARAALLLRLGEADAGRMLVQAVDVDNFSPRLRTAAIQAALATADPAGLCPIPDGAEQVNNQGMWSYVRAMCASLSGEPADALVFQRGNSIGLRPIDEQVAEKVVGAGPSSRRAIVLDWTLVDDLTDWRFGLAAAVGAAAPDDLFARSAPRFRAYAARAPMLPLDKRLALAPTAAALGVLSSQDLVDLYGQTLEGNTDVDRDSPAGRLRQAFVGDDDAARLSALRALWQAAETPEQRYAAQILTARAVARLTPANVSPDDLAPALSALFAAGLDLQAERWSSLVAGASGEGADRAWSILAVGGPRASVPIDEGRIAAFAKSAGDNAESGGPQRVRLLVAALGGLGRLSTSDLASFSGNYGIDLNRRTSWTRAIDQAVAREERGTVLLLAAAAMQTPNWSAVPAADFYRLIQAMHRAGLDPEARMIAAEAMSRL